MTQVTMTRKELEYIDSDDSLALLIEKASESPYLAIDTEFIREKTYYPNLCLIQLAYESHSGDTDFTKQASGERGNQKPDNGIFADMHTAIIDPFEINDLRMFRTLLENEDIVKIFHAGYQDVEILLHETGVLPKNVFDTQIAATLLGQAQQPGLGAVVSTFMGISLRKSRNHGTFAAT